MCFSSTLVRTDIAAYPWTPKQMHNPCCTCTHRVTTEVKGIFQHGWGLLRHCSFFSWRYQNFFSAHVLDTIRPTSLFPVYRPRGILTPPHFYPVRACASKGLCDRSWCLLYICKKKSNFFLSFKILTFRHPFQHRKASLRI